MNEFPEGHVKVPSWEFVHFAHCQKFLTSQGFLSGTILQAKVQNTEQEKTEIE